MMTSDLNGGGAERQFSYVARGLPADRFEIQLAFWRPVFRYPFPPDLPVHMIPKTKPWHVLRVIQQTRALIDRIRPDVIFSQPHYVNMVTGSALAATRHRPAWACRQVNDPRREMPPGLRATWARWALRRVDALIGPSRGVRHEVERYLRVPRSKTVHIDNLADVANIDRAAAQPLPVARDANRFIALHIARLEPQKNQKLLLEATAGLKDTDLELWILGEGRLQAPLRTLARSLGIESRIRWLGFQENPYPFLKSADAVVLSSDYEGLPNVLIEAMICGTATVATRCPFGPEELIADGETGFLVPVGDAVALGRRLRDLYEDRGLTVRMGETARRRALDRFDTAQLTGPYERLFSRLAQRNTEP